MAYPKGDEPQVIFVWDEDEQRGQYVEIHTMRTESMKLHAAVNELWQSIESEMSPAMFRLLKMMAFVLVAWIDFCALLNDDDA
ncbi:MAG: hypothetical protein CL607_15000 [Anaerolineaceae bacterium]|nr:hypothetical protein [Anaerolineaceae bacterium]